MADHGGNGPSTPEVVVADTAQEESAREPLHKVRFSQDLDRATTHASAAPRPGTPTLILDTASGPKSPVEVAGAPGLALRKALSPTSPQSRNRGYSLRRSLFSRNINIPEATDNGIELAEAGTTAHGGGKGGDEKTGGAIGSVVNSGVLSSQNALDASESDPALLKTEEKKTGPRVHLPNHGVYARTINREYPMVKKLQNLYEEKIYKPIFGKKQLPPSKDGRHVNLDASRKTPVIDERTGKEHIGNKIRSSRYTIWDFIPRQLIFQFSKLANFYFLLVSILQMIPGLSPVGSYTTIAPLLLFIAISMGKEGWDDLRRNKLDEVENNKETLVLRTHHGLPASPSVGSDSLKKPLGKYSGILLSSKEKSGPLSSDDDTSTLPSQGTSHWETMKWKDVKVGDIIKLQRDDDVPADIVLLQATGVNGIAYIETMALDGETNLKTKTAPPPLAKRCSTLDDLIACRANIVIEDPNLDLYNFDGRVTVDDETLPLTTNEIVFRGSTLRNTASAMGLIINSGEECKIRMNANTSPRIKTPAMQSISNKIVVMLVLFVILLSSFCSVGYQIWTTRTENNSWYLDGAHISFSFTFVGFIILYNTLIPLSLYVSLEIIKVGLFVLMKDVDMYDPISDTPMVCNTTTILENLGQVDYIFSDKTGTLTDNIMRFRKLSVAGYAWLHDFDLRKEAIENRERNQENMLQEEKGKGVADASATPSKQTSRPNPVRNDTEMTADSLERPAFLTRTSTQSIWKSNARPAKAQPELNTEELLKYIEHKPHSIFTKKAKFFLLSLALCHTCLPEVQENGDVEFQAASPDELALVRAAQECGYLVIDRASRTITLSIKGIADGAEPVSEVYEILDVVEFSSKRKRMSIIVRFPNGKICIFCKGADSAILPRLKLSSLALEKVNEVNQRSSRKKSMEVEEALRRISESSPRTSFSRPSITISRPSMTRSRKSIGNGRPSMASTRMPSIRDEVNTWLTSRENDVDLPDENLSVYHTPRHSMATPRPSMGVPRDSYTSTRSSVREEYYDDLIDEGLVLDDSAVFERCFQHTNDFASEGLRTLLFGYRFVDDHEYVAWKKTYLDATTSLVDRQNKIEEAGELIEQNLDLAGATAIEDKLQSGVPETIDKLRRANIKIWMLTGDKRETAINIAHSARICKTYSEIIVLDYSTGEVEERMAASLLEISRGGVAHSVVVVDGQTLAEIDNNEALSLLFFDLAVVADSVICCRASPSQKASLVKKIRTKVNDSMTLAIGDGANDIAMIQEAHVGIGISGKEGLQAARISDYSIAQFRFLQKLLLVHGRWNYVRIGKYILGTFWKELMFYIVAALYQQWCGYTGTSIFESTSLTVFNTLFTSLAVILLGMFEQDLSSSTLLAVPELYVQGPQNAAFNFRLYIGWTFMATCEAMIIYFLLFCLFGNAPFNKDGSVLGLGQLGFSASVIFINIKLLLLEFHNLTIIPILGFFITIAGWWLWNGVLSVIFKPNKDYLMYPMLSAFTDHYGRDFVWWLVLLLTLACLTLFELAISSIRKTFWPTDTDIFQELQKDPVIRARFEETVAREEAGLNPEPTKTSLELRIEAEAEVQELLNRPRVMPDTHLSASGAALHKSSTADLEAEAMELRARYPVRGSGANLSP